MSEHILSLSYGKDSIACIEAVKQLDYPLERIVHSEVWATDNISADYPEMVEFKQYADKIIKKRYGIEVEHLYATDKNGNKLTYEKLFYTKRIRGKYINQIYGFPMTKGAWCNDRLKVNVLSQVNGVYYIGIAVDEIERVKRHQNKKNIMLPLVDISWTEEDCYKWCESNNLLSPVYSNNKRGGCWFCHNMQITELRRLRNNYPNLWEILLKWDTDSPVSFKPNHTVHDFDKRFEMEDKKLVPTDRKFRWKMIEECK